MKYHNKKVVRDMVQLLMQLDVMKLSIEQLKEKLKKRGWVTCGNKNVLQVCLKEAINFNVPDSEEAGGGEAPCPEFMVGLDVMVRGSC